MTTIRTDAQPPTADLVAIPDDRRYTRFIWFSTVVGASLLWLVPMASSLWLDELVTWWVIKDSLGETIHRAYAFQGQTIVYYVFEWALRHLGSQEWVLRVPSLIALVAAAYILFRLAERLLDREYAQLSVLLFVLCPAIAFEASNARPYAFAMLLLLGSVLALVGWLDSPTPARAAVFIVLAALIGYAHILFVLALPPMILYAVVRYREGSTTVVLRRLVGAFAVVTALDLGLALEVTALLGRRGVLSLANVVSFDSLARLVVPTAIFTAIVLGSIIAWFTVGWRFDPPALERSTVVLVVSWLVFPTAVLIALDFTTSIHLFEPRYTLMAAPAAVLLAAAIVHSIDPRGARTIIVGLLVLFSVMASFHFTKVGDDWRWAAATVNARGTDHSVVLLQPGLIESSQLDWFADPERASYLETPASYYPFDAPIVPVPYYATSDATDFLDAELAHLPSGTDRIYFVSRYPGDPFGHYLDGLMKARGWTAQETVTQGGTTIAEYDRPALT
jgi:mannosyltransferase